MFKKLCFILFYIVIFNFIMANTLKKPVITNTDYYKKTAVLIEWEKITTAKGYIIYKKNKENKFEKYDITEKNSYVDIEIEDNSEYSYKIAAYDNTYKEGDKTEDIIVYTKFYPRETMDIYPRRFKLGEKIIVYFSDKKSKKIKRYRKKMYEKDKNISKEPKKIFMRYGYNDWASEYFEKGGTEVEMEYDEKLGYWKYEMVVPTFIREIDFAFRDELNNWDTNNNKDYKIRAIESNSGIYFVK